MNNVIKAHVFHIHHILNELSVSWASITQLSKPLNEFALVKCFIDNFIKIYKPFDR